ncbi:hypothetical protein ACF08N_33685 [Streptomyces sp. NPDC015127]|uniref:hypothetical protein n=1 Tax=Streptomyces sp. NPDC015127 TaxID=3364939 RepID=UPI0036F555E0
MTGPQSRSSRIRSVAVRSRRHATVLLLAGSLFALAGCSNSGGNASPIESSPAQTAGSPSPSSTVDAEDAAVIAAYRSSWDAQAEAYGRASSAGTDLKKNTTFRALTDIEADLAAMRKAGQVTAGKPALQPKVVRVTDSKIPTATVEDCVDTTNWTLIDRASKEKVPLPAERLTRYVSTATLEKWGTKWMVTNLTAQDQAC